LSTELERLEAQLKRSFEGQAWHGPSVLEALKDIAPDVAWSHPIGGAHSIWELVLHLSGTYRLVLRRLGGENAPLTPAEDWPAVPPPTPAAWGEAIRSLRELNEQVRDAIRGFSPQQLDQPLTPGGSYTAYTQFIGITQHDVYHAGQIVLLKRPRREGVGPDLASRSPTAELPRERRLEERMSAESERTRVERAR
jgi:uncharacterized damage-inducible protein DinB